MTRSLPLLKSEIKDDHLREDQVGLRCTECRGAFQKPILATITSSGSVQTYYACPHCLAKVSEVEDQKKKETRTISTSIGDVKKAGAKLEENVKCKHFLGYLKKRPENTPIPEECLTCSKMIECLLH